MRGKANHPKIKGVGVQGQRGGKKRRIRMRERKRMGGAASDKGETKIGDASFHMTSGDVMKMDGRPRRSA